MSDNIDDIKSRNARVEADKAWETSYTRRAIIALMTYSIAGVYMTSLGISEPWLNAFVPTGGYVLSTLSLFIVKRLWLNKIYD